MLLIIPVDARVNLQSAQPINLFYELKFNRDNGFWSSSAAHVVLIQEA